jgi:hypothetical protein
MRELPEIRNFNAGFPVQRWQNAFARMVAHAR